MSHTPFPHPVGQSDPSNAFVGPPAGGGGGNTEGNQFGDLLGGVFGLLGQKAQNKQLGATQKFLQEGVGFNPFGFQGAGGGLTFEGGQGQAQLSAQQQALQQQIGQQSGNFLGGGLFNDPNFQQAFGQNDIAGAFGGAQQGLQQQLGANAFGGLGGLFGQFGAGQQFAQNQFLQGPQDLTGGLQNQLFGQSQGFLQGAQGGALGAQNASLAASRALAQPFEQRQILQDESRRFAQGRLDTTGGIQQGGDLRFQQLLADNARVGQAQQIGNQTFQQNIGAGLGLQNAGAGLFGQNLGQFNQFGQQALQFGQAQQGAELGGFGQLLQQLQQNQSSGNQRLQNSLGLFGLGNEVQQGAFGTGLQGQQSLTESQRIQQELFLGSLNAESNRIGAFGQSSQAISGLGQSQAASKGGFLSGAGKVIGTGLKVASLFGFSDRRLKKNLKRIGEIAGFNLYTWTWNALAKKVGADSQPEIGVIAQEVRETRPDLIGEQDGYLTVDYEGIL